MEEKLVFETSYNENKISKIIKHRTKKNRKISIISIIISIIFIVSFIACSLIKYRAEFLGLGACFLFILTLNSKQLYNISFSKVRKEFYRNIDLYPKKVVIELGEEIKITSALSYGVTVSTLNYSGIIEKTIIDDFIYIRFLNNTMVAFETDNNEEVLKFIENQKEK